MQTGCSRCQSVSRETGEGGARTDVGSNTHRLIKFISTKSSAGCFPSEGLTRETLHSLSDQWPFPSPPLRMPFTLSLSLFRTHTHIRVVRGSELEAVLSNSATGGEQCHSQTFSSGCRTSVNCIISGIVLADTPANCSAYGHLLNHQI